MHERPPFDADQVSAIEVHELSACPCCGGSVEPTDDGPHILQKVELIDTLPWEVTEHQTLSYYCARCACVQHAPLPDEMARGGMLGPKMLALIGYMKGMLHASFSTIRKYFRDVLKFTISRSRLAKAVDQVSQSLAFAHDELGAQLATQPTLRIDETEHKDNGQRYWTWCFRPRKFHMVSHRPDAQQPSPLRRAGEEFDGVLSCDYFSAYRKYMRVCDVRVQFCLAHLIRDLKYLKTLPDAKTAAYGRRRRDITGLWTCDGLLSEAS